jgi:sugar transferase (PEP-CTERM/EpsH1 system associated)
LKVLFLSQRVPFPPDRGDRITTHHFLQHLLAGGADVRVGCLSDEATDEESIRHLAGQVREIHAPRIRRSWRKITSLRGLCDGSPLTNKFYFHASLKARVDAWMQEDPPDLVYVYSSSMAQYVLHHPGPVRLMQFAELDSDKWRQYAAHSHGPRSWLYRREAARLLAFESVVARSFDTSFVVSTTEKELFERCIPGVTPVVLPNGVDTTHFRAGGGEQDGPGERGPHTLIFTGVMDYEPNVHGVSWFVRECWPDLRAAFPDARLLIVGSRPVPSVQAMHGRDGIEVTGRVAAIPPYLDRAALAIAPLHLARGIQNKVLEAMSSGLPVVSSPQAAQGLEAGAEDAGLFVAADARATVAAVSALLADPRACREHGRRAARFVRERFRWERMYGILDAVLAEHFGGAARRADG